MLHELDPSHVVISQVMLLHQSEAVYVNNQIIAVEILDMIIPIKLFLRTGYRERENM